MKLWTSDVNTDQINSKTKRSAGDPQKHGRDPHLLLHTGLKLKKYQQMYMLLAVKVVISCNT